VFGLLASPIAALLFNSSTHQAEWEAPLAILATLLVAWILMRRGSVPLTALAAGAAFMVVRQTMIIGAVLWAAAVNAGSTQASVEVLAGLFGGLAAAAIWILLARGLPARSRRRATLVFAVMCLAQAALYAFHRSAEARLIPWGDVLDPATEPYGPDGIYGAWFSVLTFIVPAGIGVLMTVLSGARKPFAISGAMLGLAGIAVTAAAGRAMPIAEPAAAVEAPVAVATADFTAMTKTPHILFRASRMDANYGKMAVTGLQTPGQQRVATNLGCDRVSYGSSGGICLRAERGLRTAFTAVLFDSSFHTTKTIPLDGQPSRTRVSPDGRVGAFTAFVTGLPHGYATIGFSTKTTLVDMATGDVIGDLEQFTTWRDGQKFKAADFNFWGVTFARNSNTFFATLQTGGKTFLVRGDLPLRKLTVMREGVECPSLSPDNTLIAFKKKVGPALAPWRLYVLDLATMTDRPIDAETRSVDDQLEWLDATHVLYGIERSSAVAIRDVWIAPIDGSGAAHVYLPEAESPIVVR
jgi:hypothetical protein